MMTGSSLMAAAKRISVWGIANIVLLLGGRGFGEYNLYLHDHTGRPWILFAVANQICAVVLLAAVVCGVIAMRRGSKWWVLTAIPALLFAVVYYLGDL
ncbi:MAG TPA: carbon starvation CstA 5TM domain-containing protein [Vicinamibacterales bacterium]|nr:carbon starvation CstA 5TM domain-containing protein [Vicinamibacterales bacterium]